MKYRLNKAETVPITLYKVAATKRLGGRDVVTFDNYLTLAPGKEYETDDVAMLNWLRDYKREVKQNARQLEEILKANGVPYEVRVCRSCGGKVKAVSYHVVEVYE